VGNKEIVQLEVVLTHRRLRIQVPLGVVGVGVENKGDLRERAEAEEKAVSF
jgi:hypothetical protein